MFTTRLRSRLSQSIQIDLIKYFCAGSTDRFAADLTGGARAREDEVLRNKVPVFGLLKR